MRLVNTLFLGSLMMLSACASVSKSKQGRLNTNEIDQVGIRETINAHKDEILSCYSPELDRHPGLQGTVVVNFDIDKGGKVVRAEIDHKKTTLKSVEVNSCLIHAFSGWTFPNPPPKKVIEASYPLTFYPN